MGGVRVDDRAVPHECPSAHDRWLAKVRGDPRNTPGGLAELEARVIDQRDEFSEPLDLGVPVIEVETTDGYDPPLDVLVAEILRLGAA